MMVRYTLFLAATLTVPMLGLCAEVPVRLNEIQVIGTHNSYHIEPPKPVMDLIKVFSNRAAKGIAYTHRPLTEQFGELGIRQIELDLYADPKGGLFAKPLARTMLKAKGSDPGSHDSDGALAKPGLKIIHSPDFDYFTTTLTFADALQKIREWSKANPKHVPIMILLELKESGWPLGVKPLKFDAEQLDGVDKEILAVFKRDEILAPDDVRGGAKTLREAVVGEKGWPTLDAVRGKVMFALDNGGRIRDAYVKDHPSLRGRLLFATVDEKDPAAAFFKINDPVGASVAFRDLCARVFSYAPAPMPKPRRRERTTRLVATGLWRAVRNS